MPRRAKSPARSPSAEKATTAKTTRHAKAAKPTTTTTKLRNATPPTPTKKTNAKHDDTSKLPSIDERTKRLVRLSKARPGLLALYSASCWSYTVVGAWYWHIMRRMPAAFHTTAFMPGYAFALLLIVQGAVSYMNDAVCTLGIETKMGRSFWLTVDRLLAWALAINTVGTALTWPHAGSADMRATVSHALVVSLVLTYPTSKFCEVTGRMAHFVFLHSLWHYVPCCLAAVWLTLNATF